MTIFHRRGHWKTNSNGTTFWVSEHSVSREDWDRYYTGNSLDRRNVVQSGETIKQGCLEYSSFVNPNANCPVCGEPVFYYESPYGGKVYFDSLGPPWPKHPCIDSPISETLPTRRIHQNEWQNEHWIPFQTKEIEVYENSILKIYGIQISEKREFTVFVENTANIKDNLLKNLSHIKYGFNNITVSTFEIIQVAKSIYIKESKCNGSYQDPTVLNLIEKTVIDSNISHLWQSV